MTLNRASIRRFPLLTLGLLAAPAAAHAQYTAFDLGVAPAGTVSKAFAIDNAGYITGYFSTTGTTPTHAFLINGNLLAPSVNNAGADLGTTGGLSSNGYAVNTIAGKETVVGNSVNGVTAGSLRAAYFDPAGHDVGTLTGATGTGLLRGVNSSGLAVGYSNNGATAVTYQLGSVGGLVSLAPSLGNPAISQAYGVNNSGQISGYYGPTAGSNQVFRYDTATSTLKSLGTLGGVSATSDPNGGPYGINAAGNIAGFAKTSTGALHAFLYNGVNDVTTGLQLHDLGTLVPGSNTTAVLSEAYGINTQGDVVGNSNFVGGPGGNGIGAFHAYIYKSGSAFGGAGLFDLNTAANLAGSGFTSFNLAYGINDNGWIVGQGVAANGQSHAFLLKPLSVPEPSAVLAIGMGLFGAGLALRRRARK